MSNPLMSSFANDFQQIIRIYLAPQIETHIANPRNSTAFRSPKAKRWESWAKLATFAGRSDLFDHWWEAGGLNDMSVYAYAVVAGASQTTARLAQICAALFAAGNVLVTFRRKRPPDLRLAVLLTCAFLAAPHVSNYDAVLLTVAATLVFKRSFAGGLPIWYMPLAGLVWLCPIANPPVAFHVGVYSPVLICLFLMALVVPHADWTTRPRLALQTN
jgi:hypothetical protein